MLPQPSPSIYQSSKCFVTYGMMGHIDPNQPPSKGKPWTALSYLNFIHKVDLIVPQSCYEAVRQKISEREVPSFYRVSMTLGQVLETGFLTEYIKKGNILMLSEGKNTINNMFTLREGRLDMFLDRETFERAGLEGKPHGAKGNRGSKPRWKVTYDLRSPAMLHGKRGFERLVYACKNVLNQPLTWLLCNAADSDSALEPALLEKLAATRVTASLEMMDCTGVPQIPLQLPTHILTEGDRSGLEEMATDIYEWISLVRLESPRVTANDAIDPYLSRYSIPDEEQAGTRMHVCKMSWQGFISSAWLRRLLIDVISMCPPRSWLVLSATTFSQSVAGGCAEMTFLRPPEKAGEFLMWEARSSE